MDKNRIRGRQGRTSGQRTAKSTSIKGTGCKSGGCARKVAELTSGDLKERIRELTRQTGGVSVEKMAEELSRYLRGWQGYFGFCRTLYVLRDLEYWLRRRPGVSVEAVEAWNGTIRGAYPPGSEPRSRCSNSGKRSRPLAACRISGSPLRSARCLLRLARHSATVRQEVAQSAEPPYT
jgi:hypothetical protein